MIMKNKLFQLKSTIKSTVHKRKQNKETNSLPGNAMVVSHPKTLTQVKNI